MKQHFIFASAVFFIVFSLFALPKTIIIVRHGDGFYDPDKGEELGPALSKDGYYRTFVFTKYYLEVINKEKGIPMPNYIFACNPYSPDSRHDMAKSVRHIQTVSPLVTWMFENMMDKTPDDILQIPYSKEEYKELAKLLVEEEYVNDKTVLVCWSHEVVHHMIDCIREYSQYSMDSNWPEEEKWRGGDFESLVIIKCDNASKKITVERIHGVLKLPKSAREREELLKWFFKQYKD